MTHGGAAWFANLTVTDPYMGLPVLCMLGTLTMTEFGLLGMEQPGQDSKQQVTPVVGGHNCACGACFTAKPPKTCGQLGQAC
jgi:hypothetical protein